MSQELRFTADTSGERVDAFLARIASEHSRAFWQKRCEAGEVTLRDAALKVSHKLRVGDEIVVNLPVKPDFEQLQIPIIYEDDDVVVLNKPAGMLTHAKGQVSEEFSVGEFMRTRSTDGTETNRPGIVHRLDRGTSGVIIAAKNSEAKQWLQKQFSQRKVKKTYLALVEGHLKESAANIDLPIERNPRKPQTFRVGVNGKPAETAYTTEEVFVKNTLLRLKPHTGRTHQLRVHLSHMHHPIVGDHIYGKEKTDLGRMFLHAAELELTLPSRERKTFSAPLPAELQDYLKRLK